MAGVRAGRKRLDALIKFPFHLSARMSMTPLDPGSDEQFNDSFEQVVHLGNRLANDSQAAELWDIADGILAGAVQFWLYSRQPCGDRSCEDCAPVSTAEGRMAELLKNIRQFAEESEYFHSPTDSNAGRA